MNFVIYNQMEKVLHETKNRFANTKMATEVANETQKAVFSSPATLHSMGKIDPVLQYVVLPVVQ